MSPSVTRIRIYAVLAALRATVKHYTSKDYPRDWDLQFHIQFAILRNLLCKHTKGWTIEEFQELTTKCLPVLKGMWSIPVQFTAPESEKEGLLAGVRNVVSKLGPGVETLEFNIAELSGEWQGVKHITDAKTKMMSPQEQFAELSQDLSDKPVILYIHGGAYILCSPDTHRAMTLRLAECCQGRVFAVKYRLAPQEQFPAALIDAVMAYKYLIDPPVGALHTAIDPAKIVIAGDSAGGCLATALMMFLAHAAPAYPLPAGVIGTSPWLDLTHSFPSARVDRGLDYLPNPWETPTNPKPSKLWPPAVPRYHFYSDLPLHPLVSPVVAAGELPPCPPMMIAVGNNEYLRDETLYFAYQFAQNGGKVRLQSYLAMPHIFPMFQKHPSTKTCFRQYAKFIREVTSGESIETEMQIVNGKGIIEAAPLEFESYQISFTKEELLKRMESEVSRRYEMLKLHPRRT